MPSVINRQKNLHKNKELGLASKWLVINRHRVLYTNKELWLSLEYSVIPSIVYHIYQIIQFKWHAYCFLIILYLTTYAMYESVMVTITSYSFLLTARKRDDGLHVSYHTFMIAMFVSLFFYSIILSLYWQVIDMSIVINGTWNHLRYLLRFVFIWQHGEVSTFCYLIV